MSLQSKAAVLNCVGSNWFKQVSTGGQHWKAHSWFRRYRYKGINTTWKSQHYGSIVCLYSGDQYQFATYMDSDKTQLRRCIFEDWDAHTSMLHSWVASDLLNHNDAPWLDNDLSTGRPRGLHGQLAEVITITADCSGSLPEWRLSLWGPWQASDKFYCGCTAKTITPTAIWLSIFLVGATKTYMSKFREGVCNTFGCTAAMSLSDACRGPHSQSLCQGASGCN